MTYHVCPRRKNQARIHINVCMKYKKFHDSKICQECGFYREGENEVPGRKKSAKKALRQNAKRRARNLVYKKKMKDLIKKARSLVLEKKIEEAKKLLPQIYKVLDKSAKVGVIKKNTAARKKSRITKSVNKTSN